MELNNKYNFKNTTHRSTTLSGVKMIEMQDDECIFLTGIDECHLQMIVASFFAIVSEKEIEFNEIGGLFDTQHTMILMRLSNLKQFKKS